MVSTDARFGLWQTRVKNLLAQQGCLKMLWKVMSGKMELSCDGWKFAEDDLGAWVGLDSLTDRRESVGTEDGGGIGDDDIGA